MSEAPRAMPGQLGARSERRVGFHLSQRQIEQLTAYLFISPWFIGFILFTLGAMIFSLGISTFDTDFLTEFKFVGLGNYSEMISNELFHKSLLVTFTYTVLTVPIATTIALVVALLLNQRVLALGFWRTVYYLPAVVSGVAVALLWGWLLNPEFGLLNEALRLVGLRGPRWFASEEWAVPGLVMISLWGTGTNMLLYLAGLQGIPTELQEAAKIDGAGSARLFFSITLPLLTPVVFFNVVMNVISSFQVFTTAFILTNGGPNNATLTLVLYIYREGFQHFNFGYASALAWFLFGLILLFTLLIVRNSALWVYYEGGLRR